MDRDALLAGLLSDPPPLHGDDGARQSFGVAPEALEVIRDAVRPGSRTLETGAGVSTCAFAVLGAVHDCVVPVQHEIDRIRAWCAEHGVDASGLRFHAARSQDALPRLEPEPLDFVLIDGAHAFPVPFVDFEFAALRLRAGGTLLIDDVHLWTGATLRAFLDEQPGWEAVAHPRPERFAVFRRTEVLGDVSWTEQPFVARRSHTGEVQQRASRALAMLREGDVRTLAAKARTLATSGELSRTVRSALADLRARRSP
jgi:methyltransferase family protein